MTGLVVNRERIWAQWRRKDGILVKLPADPDSYQNYLKKGLEFIKYGKDSEIPMATVDFSKEKLASIVPVIEPVKVEEEPPLYVSDKPYKSKKKRR